MECINRVTLSGYVGKDPELKTFQNGNPVATFSLATSYFVKNKETAEKTSYTDWHRIVCFSSRFCNLIQSYVRKGSRIYLEGVIKTREYENKNKIKQYITEIVLNDFHSKLILLDKKDEEKENKNLIDISTSSVNHFLDDEIPF